MKTGLFTFVLACVNIYFYQQFILTKNVDEASFTLSEDTNEFMNQVQETDTAEINELSSLIDEIKKNNEVLISNIDDNSRIFIENDNNQKFTRVKFLKEKLSAIQDELVHDTSRINFFTDTLEKYHKLNVRFPTIAYYVSAGAVIIRFIIYTVLFIHADKPFLDFFDKDLEILKLIFEDQK